MFTIFDLKHAKNKIVFEEYKSPLKRLDVLLAGNYKRRLYSIGIVKVAKNCYSEVGRRVKP